MASDRNRETIPRLKVEVSPDGRITPYRRAGAREPVDDSWWQDVLRDPRAAEPAIDTRIAADSPYAFYRLDRQHGAELMIKCGCGLHRIANKADLIEKIGGDANVMWLARYLIDCGRTNKIDNYCKAYCVR